jgi:hypothetical protein
MHNLPPKAPRCPSSLSCDPQAVAKRPRINTQNPQELFPGSGDLAELSGIREGNSVNADVIIAQVIEANA